MVTKSNSNRNTFTENFDLAVTIDTEIDINLQVLKDNYRQLTYSAITMRQTHSTNFTSGLFF